MSSIPTSIELNNSECEKGHVTQRPPIPYAISKAGRVRQAPHGLRPPHGEEVAAVLKASLTLKKHAKVPKGESDPLKAARLIEVKAAERELAAAKVIKSTITCLAYDLF